MLQSFAHVPSAHVIQRLLRRLPLVVRARVAPFDSLSRPYLLFKHVSLAPLPNSRHIALVIFLYWQWQANPILVAYLIFQEQDVDLVQYLVSRKYTVRSTG